jgi:hypothetical protein
MPQPGERPGTIQRVLVADGPPVMGLMSVPLEWVAATRKKPEALFDSCTNRRVATDLLKRFDAACRAEAPRAPQPQLRACIAGNYGATIRLPDLPIAVAT